MRRLREASGVLGGRGRRPDRARHQARSAGRPRPGRVRRPGRHGGRLGGSRRSDRRAHHGAHRLPLRPPPPTRPSAGTSCSSSPARSRSEWPASTPGLASSAAQAVVEVASPFGTRAVLGVVLVFTALLTQVVSNNATAAVMTPIAFELAQLNASDPLPFVMAVAFGANCSFLTPGLLPTRTSSCTGRGGYRFGDFSRFGLPLGGRSSLGSRWCCSRFSTDRGLHSRSSSMASPKARPMRWNQIALPR